MCKNFCRRLPAALAAGIFLLLLASTPARADLAAGRAALEAGDFARAYILLLPQAEAGEAESQYEIGLMLDSGRGVAAVLSKELPIVANHRTIKTQSIINSH